MLLLCALVAGSGSVWADVVDNFDITALTLASNTTMTNEGVSSENGVTNITFKSGTNSTKPIFYSSGEDIGFRLYKDNSMTITGKNGAIIKEIVFTYKINKSKSKNPTITSVTGNVADGSVTGKSTSPCTWTGTGSDTEVTLKMTNDNGGNFQFSNIKVTYADAPHVSSYNSEMISYPVSKSGITAHGSSEANQTLKIHSNTDSETGYALSNTYLSGDVLGANYILLEVDGGFKTGDVVTIKGAINNSDASKRATAVLFYAADEGSATTTIKTFDDFVNGYSSSSEPATQSFTLTSEYDKLYLGRDGNTKALLLTIKVARPSVVVSVTDAGWTSFSSNKEVKIPSGITAYYASMTSSSSVTLSEITGGYIPASEGVVLSGEEGTYAMNITTTSATLPGSNSLHACLSDGDVPGSGDYYTLGVSGSDPIFKKSSKSGTLAAGKAYLTIESGDAHELDVNFTNGSEATGIDAIKTNGIENNTYYNLAGQRVTQPTKGLYIVNGKKVIIK